jgi:Flp pilus assembly protein TadG
MAWQPRSRNKRPLSGERGAALIEFAFAFPVFFLLIYALLAYGILFTLQQSMVLAAEEGVRAAIALDPDHSGYPIDYPTAVTTTARDEARSRLQWLPSHYSAVFDKDENLKVTFDPATRLLTLEVVYPETTTGDNQIIPLIVLPGLGEIPPMPEALRAEASFQL